MQNYVSLIIDIEKSKTYKVEERNEIQNYMSDYVELLNNLFEKNLECKVMFSGGDELQGLFLDVTTSFLYFRLLEILMMPVSIRAGIGIGEWTVKAEGGLSTQQDGPAYHRARKAINDVHRMQLHNVRICSEKDDLLVNNLINASIVLKRQQIYMQNIVLAIMELLYPFATKKISFANKEAIKEILITKFNSKQDMRKKRTIDKKSILNVNEIADIDIIIIDGKMVEAEKVIMKKNVSSAISKILGCSRQNVDSIIKRGNANKIRELDYIALQYMINTLGEKIWSY